jgi:hypothetical protein
MNNDVQAAWSVKQPVKIPHTFGHVPSQTDAAQIKYWVGEINDKASHVTI